MRSPFTWSAARPKSNSAPTPPPICMYVSAPNPNQRRVPHIDILNTTEWRHCEIVPDISSRCGSYTFVSMGSSSSYLACGHELKRAERDLEVGRVGLEVVESSRDAGLQLGGALARGARGRDLVEGAHGCGGCRWEDWERRCEIQKTIFFCVGWREALVCPLSEP